MENADLSDIAARMKHRRDAEEASLLEKERAGRAHAQSVARSKEQEREGIALVDDIVAEINAQFPQPLIRASDTPGGREYRFSNRILKLHFFRPDELYEYPLVPGRMETLRRRYAVHGGYIEIKAGGEDRQGWNLVLVRPPESTDGEWRIVETRVSGLSGRLARFEPFATEAQLFADNLACHWSSAMHTFNLSDKPLDRADLVKILNTFVPK